MNDGVTEYYIVWLYFDEWMEENLRLKKRKENEKCMAMCILRG